MSVTKEYICTTTENRSFSIRKNVKLYYWSELTYKIIFYSFYEVKISGKMKKVKVKNYKLESFSWSSSQGSRNLLVLTSGIKYEQFVYNIKNLYSMNNNYKTTISYVKRPSGERGTQPTSFTLRRSGIGRRMSSPLPPSVGAYI